ncbi:MAG TPA: phospho-N-acetylmuramoyl-pentapeptide-transferase [Rickettsiales bacterium]|nr:phospho-N-acetylmuramoyl-pentapeptide-transferase [Rickettsiales bacterium]
MFFNCLRSVFVIYGDVNFLLLRSALAFIAAFFITFFILKFLINFLKKSKLFQPIRSYGPETHAMTKKSVPTFGGLACCLGLLVSTLLFCDASDIYVIATLIISMSFGLIGLIDDITKVFYKNTNGFKGSIKIILETLICGIVILWLIANDSPITNEEALLIPFFHYILYIGILFIPFIIFVIIGSSNAVNLTDGLDGLLIVPVMLCTTAFLIISIFSIYGINANFIKTMNFDNPSELAIMCSAVIGTGIAFLMFNRYPARIFMGDVGSLMYGAFLGTIAVLLKYEVLFAIIGFVFVLEALSDIIQVSSYMVFKKGVFKMAPLHHHFEKSGWSERKVVLIFWCFSLICLIVGFLGIINFG